MPGRPTILIMVGQGPIALAVGAGGGGFDILLPSILSPLSPSLWKTARYRLKYCLKRPFNPKQPTNNLTAYFIRKWRTLDITQFHVVACLESYCSFQSFQKQHMVSKCVNNMAI